jgi:hypothetical protein
LAGRSDADGAHAEQDGAHESAQVRARQLAPATCLRWRAAGTTQTNDGRNECSGGKGQEGTSEGSHVGPVGFEPTSSHGLTTSMAPHIR